MPTVRRLRPLTRYEHYSVQDDDGEEFSVYSVDPRTPDREAILLIVDSVDEVPRVFRFSEAMFDECVRPSKRAALIAVRAFRDRRRRIASPAISAFDRLIRGSRRTAWARVLAVE
jgi:hypothetical protein